MVGLMQTGNLDAGLLTAGVSRKLISQPSPCRLRRNAPPQPGGGGLRGEKLRRNLRRACWPRVMWCCSGAIRDGAVVLESPGDPSDDLRKLVFSGAGNANEFDLCGNQAGSARWRWKRPASRKACCPAPSAVPVSIFALAAQLDSQAKYMLELKWAPLVGAAVVQKVLGQGSGRCAAMLKIARETGLQVKAGQLKATRRGGASQTRTQGSARLRRRWMRNGARS